MTEIYLVTGATGAIGSAVTRYLYRRGNSVRVFVRSEQKFRNVFSEETSAYSERPIEIFTGDILQKEQLQPAMQNVSAIFHCSNFPLTMFDRNLTAAQNVLELATQQEAHVVYPGNVWVYGKPQCIPITEEHPKQPCSKLGELKLRIDDMCLEYFHKYRLPVTILYLPDFYGPFVLNPWMKSLYEAAYSGKPMNMMGNIHKQHEFIYIDDAARAMCSVVLHEEAYGQCYNVPGFCNMTSQTFSTYLYEAAGTTGSIRLAPPWLLRVMGIFSNTLGMFLEMRYLFEEEVLLDGSKLEETVGYLPEIDNRTGTQRTMYWFKKMRTESPLFSSL